ncbi:MAG: hypothetical protein LBV19_08575 [Streptococcaceae bacterium]|nr:hypothetical protein [Streptococcaceae bacterium]
MKKGFIGLLAAVSILSLSACSTNTSSKPSSSSSSKAVSAKAAAETDAQTVLDFMYKGNISGFSDVSEDSADTVKDNIIEKLEQKQIDAMIANGNLNDYYLVVDGSNYTAQEIVTSYAEAYYKQISTIGSANIESVTVSGNSAKIKASFKPIAALSEANPIGNARTELFGGLDNDTIIRQSQNKDVETIQKLITLDLYGMYYGQMGKTAAKGSDDVTISFTLTKNGSHFQADEDTLLQLAKDSRAQVYAESTGGTETSSSTDEV